MVKRVYAIRLDDLTAGRLKSEYGSITAGLRRAVEQLRLLDLALTDEQVGALVREYGCVGCGLYRLAEQLAGVRKEKASA